MIWKVKPSIDFIHSQPNKNMADHLGIELTEVGDDFMSGKMPVDERTVQPFGILHGGASCVLAETLGSIASTFCIDFPKQVAVGLEINANHLRPAKSGYVYGTVRPIHLGRTTHVWDIRITDDAGKMVCISRLTVAVINQPAS
ncbi:MAG: hotdog fold thioesterase [Chitinophagales bacterium]